MYNNNKKLSQERNFKNAKSNKQMNLQEEDINFWQIWPDKTGYVYFLFYLSEQEKTVSHDFSKIHIKLLTITLYLFIFLRIFVKN